MCIVCSLADTFQILHNPEIPSDELRSILLSINSVAGPNHTKTEGWFSLQALTSGPSVVEEAKLCEELFDFSKDDYYLCLRFKARANSSES